MMPALLTHRDRQIHGLRVEIEKLERWICADQGDRRAVAFHKAKLAELRKDLTHLHEGD
jgi:hypothetical protein